MEDSALQTGFDPSRRELCPDGACIGVIGQDGTCKECGTPSPNGPPAAPAEAETNASAEATPKTAAPDSAEAAAEDDPTVEDDAFDPSRRELCPDGACIGVIGPDGRCKECGRAAD